MKHQFYSQEVEESFLMSVMMGDFDKLSRPVFEDHFQIIDYKKIFKESMRLIQDGKELSPLALVENGCNKASVVEVVDKYTPFDINHSWQILEEYRLKRMVQSESNGILNRFNTLKGKDVAEEIQRLSNTLTEGVIVDGKIGDLAERSREYLKLLSEGSIKGMKTGLQSFDKAVGELFHGELHIIAGFPSVGKSALALQISRNMAKMGRGVRYYSLEEVEQSYMKRVISAETGFPYSAYRNGLTSTQMAEQNQLWQKVWGDGGTLEKSNFEIDDFNDTLESIHLSTMKHKNSKGLDVIVVDGATNISHKEFNPYAKNEDIAQSLLRTAKRANVCVILLAHINNDLMKKDKDQKKKKPDMSSVMGGQCLIKPAFSVTILDRVTDEFIPNQDTEIVGHLVKSRNSAPNQQMGFMFDGTRQVYKSGEIQEKGVW